VAVLVGYEALSATTAEQHLRAGLLELARRYCANTGGDEVADALGQGKEMVHYCGQSVEPSLADTEGDAACNVFGFRVHSALMTMNKAAAAKSVPGQSALLCGLPISGLPSLNGQHSGGKPPEGVQQNAFVEALRNTGALQSLCADHPPADDLHGLNPSLRIFAAGVTTRPGTSRRRAKVKVAPGFDPRGECLRTEYECLIPVVACVQHEARSVDGARGGVTLPMAPNAWQAHGDGKLSATLSTTPAAAHESESDVEGLCCTLHGRGGCLVECALPGVPSVTGGEQAPPRRLEWAMGRGPDSDVRVRLALRLEPVDGATTTDDAAPDTAMMPEGWWVGAEAWYPCMLHVAGQWEFKTTELPGVARGQWLALQPGVGLSTERGGASSAAGSALEEAVHAGRLRVARAGWFVDAPDFEFQSAGTGADATAADTVAAATRLPIVEFRACRVLAQVARGAHTSLELLARCTALLRLFDGAPRLHNFCEQAQARAGGAQRQALTGGGGGGGGGDADDPTAQSTVTRPPTDRETHLRGVRNRNHGLVWFRSGSTYQECVVVSISAPHFLPGMARRVVGTIAAALRGACSAEYVAQTLCPAAILPTASAPASALYLADCKYQRWGGNRARRLGQPLAVGLRMAEWRAKLMGRVVAAQLQSSAGECNGVRSQRGWSQSDEALAAAVARLGRAAALSPSPSARGITAAALSIGLPPAFGRVLHILQGMTAASAGGNADFGWPATSSARSSLFVVPDVNDAVAVSSSAAQLPPTPASLVLTAELAASTALWRELWAAAHALQELLAPGRSHCAAVAFNSHTQFKAHTDQPISSSSSSSSSPPPPPSSSSSREVCPAAADVGATANASHQQPTLMVGLGEYSGGELALEGVLYDIRYTPLAFDGPTQRHWTTPFVGERYTIVWML
jgi:hypothetical protein